MERDKDPEFIPTAQVAAMFQVDSSAVRKWVSTGKLIPAITTPGGHFRFRRSDIDALLSGQASA